MKRAIRFAAAPRRSYVIEDEGVGHAVFSVRPVAAALILGLSVRRAGA
jgi:hypothetical protein